MNMERVAKHVECYCTICLALKYSRPKLAEWTNPRNKQHYCEEHYGNVLAAGVKLDRIMRNRVSTYKPFEQESVWQKRRKGIADDPAYWSVTPRSHKKLAPDNNVNLPFPTIGKSR